MVKTTKVFLFKKETTNNTNVYVYICILNMYIYSIFISSIQKQGYCLFFMDKWHHYIMEIIIFSELSSFYFIFLIIH